MAPLIEVSQNYGLIITTHSSEPVGHTYQGKGQTGPKTLWRFVGNFPDAILVCAHWGGGLPFYAMMPEVKKALKNVYFDTAASPLLYDPQIFSVATSIVGANRVLFGSDSPLVSPGRLLSQIKKASLSEMEKASISGENAAHLLNI